MWRPELALNVRPRGRKLSAIGCMCLTRAIWTALPLAQHIDPPSDLQGIWNNGTVTPLERPAQFRDKPYLNPDEATEYSRTYWERDARDYEATNIENFKRTPIRPGTNLCPSIVGEQL